MLLFSLAGRLIFIFTNVCFSSCLPLFHHVHMLWMIRCLHAQDTSRFNHHPHFLQFLRSVFVNGNCSLTSDTIIDYFSFLTIPKEHVISVWKYNCCDLFMIKSPWIKLKNLRVDFSIMFAYIFLVKSNVSQLNTFI